MQPAESRAATHVEGPVHFIQWSAAIAGAVAASALSFVLITFAATLGLSIASPSPAWREASIGLSLLSGVFLLLTALASFGLGGYVAGRLRSRWDAATTDEIEFRDGVHGLLVWGLAVGISGFLAAATAGIVISRALPTAASPTTTSGEPIIAYELDRLFRADRRPADAELTYSRAEAGRIIFAASGREGLAADDRAYLGRLVSSHTGLPQPEAERRVDEVVARSRTAIARARRSAVIIGFATAAALLLGAAAAWFAACLGGRHRDSVAPSLAWQWRHAPPTNVR
jgi:hypothetical protein